MSRRPARSARRAPAPLISPTLRNRLLLAGGLLSLGALALLGPWSDKAPAPLAALAPPQPPLRAPATPEAAARPAPEAGSPAMSASLEASFGEWLIETYKQCWSPPRTLPEGDPYLPRVRVSLKADGSLAAAPRLINPPYDPAWRPQADAAVKAVKSCDPLHVPDKFAAYYPSWKTRTVFFDTTRP